MVGAFHAVGGACGVLFDGGDGGQGLFGYVGPAVLTTSWGFAVFIHAFVAVLGGALVTRHYTGQF